MNGWIILDKPLGLGSTQGVSAVKRALRTAGLPKMKVGHGGTLDPLATGVLPIAIGEATKLAGRMLDASKIYDFTIQFGEETDSLDREGQVIATSDVRPSLAQIEAVLPRFTGQIEQVPPAFSALKVDGKRAYDLARAGEVVEIKSRTVIIHALKILPVDGEGNHEVVEGGCKRATVESTEESTRESTGQAPSVSPADCHLPVNGEDFITLTAHVSKGTYIRSLARDIAQALGTVGHVSMLRRTKAGPFTLAQAISLDILEEHAKRGTLMDITLPLKTALDNIPALALNPEQARLLKFGQVLTGVAAPDGLYLAELDFTPVALVEILGETVTVERGFNL
jgi:tRNA pseudouridine55 synthase